MNIPKKAVEAAERAYSWWEYDTETKLGRMEYALEAAAPHLYAQALRDATEDLYSYRNSIRTMEGAVVWMHDRADEMDPQ